MDNTIKIPVNINISDKDIERLEKAKQLLQDIKELNSNFCLSNIININEGSILIFNSNTMLFKQEDLNEYERLLTYKTKCKCIILRGDISLDKVIGIDYAKERDYTTTTYYNENGNPVKEEMTQYK